MFQHCVFRRPRVLRNIAAIAKLSATGGTRCPDAHTATKHHRTCFSLLVQRWIFQPRRPSLLGAHRVHFLDMYCAGVERLLRPENLRRSCSGPLGFSPFMACSVQGSLFSGCSPLLQTPTTVGLLQAPITVGFRKSARQFFFRCQRH